MDSCNGGRRLSCLSIIVAGLSVLASMAVDAWMVALAVGVALSGVASAIAPLSGRRLCLAVLLLASSLLLGLAGGHSLYVSIAASFAASLVASGRHGVSGGLTALLAPLPGLTVQGLGDEWITLYSGLALVAASLYAYEHTGRGHSFTIASVSPLVFVSGPAVALAAALAGLQLSALVAGLTTSYGCPFRRDSGMAFTGVVLVLIGVLAGLLTGFGPGEATYTLWLTGYLFLVAASLVPLSHKRPATSWEAGS